MSYGGSMSRCLVTGGRGFIGSHLVDVLRERGHAVETYDVVDGQNVLDRAMLEAAVSAVDAVFDVSGVLGSAETFAHIERAVDTNITGTLSVLDACAAYGLPLVFLSLKAAWHNPYMITKQAATAFCQMYAEYRNLRVSVVRGMNAYGPGQHWGAVRKIVPTFVMRALANEPLRIFGNGQQMVDLIHARDLAEIMVRLWEQDVWGVVLDGGTGVPLTVAQLAQKIIDMVGSSSVLEYEPMRPGEPPLSEGCIADPTDALRLLGYYPATPLEEGLAQTIAWYKAHGQDAKR